MTDPPAPTHDPEQDPSPVPTRSPGAPVPPGWYPDPWWAGSMRYHDGTQWTANARWAQAPPPPPPPLPRLRPPAAWVIIGATIAIVVAGRVVNGQLVRHVTTLRAFEMLQWGFYIVVYGGMAAAVVAVARRYGTGSLRHDLGLRVRWSDIGWAPLLFFVARFAQVLVTLPLLAVPAFRQSTEDYSETMRAQPTELLVTMVVVGVIVAPLVEEMLFRGAMLRGLLARHGAPVAVVVQGVIFGCYHFAPDLGLYNIVLITANSTFGIIFGIVALRRRGLGTGIVAHALTNASAFVVIFVTR